MEIYLGVTDPGGHLVVVVAGGAVDAVVGGLAHEVDPEGDDGDAEPRCGVAQLVPHLRVPPPLVPPPEELPGRVQPLPSARHRLRRTLFSSSLSCHCSKQEEIGQPRAHNQAQVINAAQPATSWAHTAQTVLLVG